MSDKRKKWSDLTAPYRSKVVSDVFTSIIPHCHEPGDLQQFVKHFLQKVARERPVLQEQANRLLVHDSVGGVVSALACLRAEHAEEPCHKPSITVNELDNAFVKNTPTKESLENLGYPLPVRQYGRILREEALLRKGPEGPSRFGRPSKVDATSCIGLVQEALKPHTIDSERVVVVGHGSKRRMVIARHLTKTKRRIWCDDASLHSEMSLSTFRRLLRQHFPDVRNPRRNTDVCSHCKVFEKELLPAALRKVDKVHQVLTSLCPNYFAEFQGDRSEQVKYLELFHAYINAREANSEEDPLRHELSRRQRMDLHSAEARALHLLKPHVEIVQAYNWHQVSARRQSNFVTRMRQGHLPAGGALVQVDFKENVKYPMGPNETSEEWHAQNKLSLTVFGANAIVPRTVTWIFVVDQNFLNPFKAFGRSNPQPARETIFLIRGF